MSQKRRPCRICRKWFLPSRRGGHHQKTCGTECRREWKKKKSREWREENKDCILEDQLNRRVESIESGQRKRSFMGEYPLKVAREVMGTEVAVLIELVLQLLIKSKRELKRSGIRANKGDPG